MNYSFTYLIGLGYLVAPALLINHFLGPLFTLVGDDHQEFLGKTICFSLNRMSSKNAKQFSILLRVVVSTFYCAPKSTWCTLVIKLGARKKGEKSSISLHITETPFFSTVKSLTENPVNNSDFMTHPSITTVRMLAKPINITCTVVLKPKRGAHFTFHSYGNASKWVRKWYIPTHPPATHFWAGQPKKKWDNKTEGWFTKTRKEASIDSVASLVVRKTLSLREQLTHIY